MAAEYGPKTAGQEMWDELRQTNSSMLPWAKVAPESRARLERAATDGCACGCCRPMQSSPSEGKADG